MTPDIAIENTVEPAAPRRSTAGMTTKVVKGSLWTLAGQVVPLAVSMLATPFTIRLLGSEGYGVFVLIGVIPNYFLFADFGMGMASTKFGSEAYAQGDEEKEGRIVRTAALIAAITSLPVAVTLFLLSGWVVTLFNVPEHMLGQANLALKLTAITFFVNFFHYILNTPQLTRMRMDLNSLVSSSFRVLGIVATPIVIYLGYGIAGAAAVLLAASVLTLAGHVFVSRRLTPYLFATSLERGLMKPLLNFGGALVGGAIAGLLLHNLDRGVLPRLVSVEALAHYSVGFSLAWMVATFSNAMIQSLIPAFSLLQSDESRRQLQDLYSRAIRLTLIWLIPAVVFLVLIAKPFIYLWAGEEFATESVPIFYVVLAGMGFMILSYLPYAAIMAAGRTDIFAKLYFAELLPYFLLLVFLTAKYGAIGTAAAWSARAIVDCCLLFYLAGRYARVSLTTELRLMDFVPATAIMLIPIVGYAYFSEANVIVVLLFLGAGVTYCIAMWKMILEHSERVWLRKQISDRLSFE